MVVNLAISGMRYNLESWRFSPTPVGDFLLGLKWLSPLLVQTSEVGRQRPSILIFFVVVLVLVGCFSKQGFSV